MALKDWKKQPSENTMHGVSYKKKGENTFLSLETSVFANGWFFGTGIDKFTSKNYKTKTEAIRGMKAYMRKH